MAVSTSESIRVLHVDDDRAYLDLTGEYLERQSEAIAVVGETSAAAGLNRLDAEQFDCVVSDYDMPETDGLELLEHVRTDGPDVPFILFTGKGSEEIASDAISAGVTDYVQKQSGPDHFEVLANRIESAVARHRAERKLRATKEQYRQLVEQNIVGIYVIQDDEFAFVNRQLAEIHGHDRETILGKSPTDLVAPDDRDRVSERIEDRITGDVEEVHYTFTGLGADGEPIPLEVHGGRIEYRGRPAVMGLVRDRSGDDVSEIGGSAPTDHTDEAPE